MQLDDCSGPAIGVVKPDPHRSDRPARPGRDLAFPESGQRLEQSTLPDPRLAADPDRDALPGKPGREPAIALEEFPDSLAELAQRATSKVRPELVGCVRVIAQRGDGLVDRDQADVDVPPALHLPVDLTQSQAAPFYEIVDLLPRARHCPPVSEKVTRNGLLAPK